MRHGEPLEGEKTVQVVQRIARVLGAFGEQTSLGITELAHATGLPKSTTHRLVNALVNEGLLLQQPHSHKYSLSLRIAALSASILSSHLVRKVARPKLLELHELVHETIQLAVLEGPHAVIIDSQEPYFSIRTSTTPGLHLPAYAVAIGKVLLAYQEDMGLSRLAHLLPLQAYTAHTITSLDLLMEELQQIRLLGYAISEGELEEKIEGIAAPVFSTGGIIVAALSISGPDERCHERRTELMEAVLKTARQISHLLQAQIFEQETGFQNENGKDTD